MRIAIVDESPARAAVIEEGLREAGMLDVTTFIKKRALSSVEALGQLSRFFRFHPPCTTASPGRIIVNQIG